MLKKLQVEISRERKSYLWALIIFFSLCLIVNITYFIYDVILLGIWLENNINYAELGYSIVSSIVSLICIPFLVKTARRTDKSS